MKIGKFKVGNSIGFGPVYSDCWIDLQGLSEFCKDVLPVKTFEEFLGLNQSDRLALEEFAGEIMNDTKKYSRIIHDLKESSFLAPVPERPRLFTLRGNGALFARSISLATPCHPVCELRYSHNLAGHNCTFTIQEDFEAGGWNGEIVAVVGKECRGVNEDEVYDYLAGYTIMIDHAAILKNYPFDNEWKVEQSELTITDHFYKGCFNLNAIAPVPIGPWITTTDEILDPHDLWFSERDTAKIISNVHSSGVVYSISETFSFLSNIVTLKPGDMISTASIGYDGYSHWKKYMPSSFVEVEVERIGVLRMNIDDRREAK